jgi:hypothetical protein
VGRAAHRRVQAEAFRVGAQVLFEVRRAWRRTSQGQHFLTGPWPVRSDKTQAAACKRLSARDSSESSPASSSARYVSPCSSTRTPCRVSSFIVRVARLQDVKTAKPQDRKTARQPDHRHETHRNLCRTAGADVCWPQPENPVIKAHIQGGHRRRWPGTAAEGDPGAWQFCGIRTVCPVADFFRRELRCAKRVSTRAGVSAFTRPDYSRSRAESGQREPATSRVRYGLDADQHTLRSSAPDLQVVRPLTL